MKKIFLLLSLTLVAMPQLKAQDNVAEIAHAFIKALKSNNIKLIENRFIDINAAYAILPKESAGLNARDKNNKYLKPIHQKFKTDFDKIQQEIKDKEINIRRIDLRSYKLENRKSGDPIKPLGMSLFINYNNKEQLIPVSVVEIDERWYVIEILNTTDLFK